MLLDEEYKPDPGKVLFSRDSGWSPDAPEHLKLRPLRDIPDAERPKDVPCIPGDVRVTSRVPQKTFARRATVDLPLRDDTNRTAKAALPPKNPPLQPELRKSPRRGKGRWMPWNRIQEMTIEVINALQAEGWTAARIAERFECNVRTIHKRLRLWRQSSDPAAQPSACACGRRKQTAKANCWKCAQILRNKGTRPRHPGVTIQTILRLREDGLSHRDIAERLGCERTTVFRRLAAYRKTPEGQAAEKEALACACGRTKRPQRDVCSRCLDPIRTRERLCEQRAQRGKETR